jgi:hypothetical protein
VNHTIYYTINPFLSFHNNKSRPPFEMALNVSGVYETAKGGLPSANRREAEHRRRPKGAEERSVNAVLADVDAPFGISYNWLSHGRRSQARSKLPNNDFIFF